MTLSKTELRDNEQWHGRVPRDVFDGGGAIAFESSTGTLRAQSKHELHVVTRWEAGDIGGEDAMSAIICSRSGLQIEAVSSMPNKADSETNVLLVARLSALKAACGLVVLEEPTCETIDDGGTDG